MTELVFTAANVIIVPFWLLLVLAPRARATHRVFGAPFGSALFALAYLVLIAPRLPEVMPALLAPSAGRIAALLSTPEGTTVAWLHFLAFDLFVGRAIWREALEQRVRTVALAPILLLTLLVGPIGLLCWLALRAGLRYSAVARVATLRA